jgi:hypothetical protein
MWGCGISLLLGGCGITTAGLRDAVIPITTPSQSRHVLSAHSGL